MTGIQFVTDDKGRKTAVLIDLKKHRRSGRNIWMGRIRVRRNEKGIPYEGIIRAQTFKTWSSAWLSTRLT